MNDTIVVTTSETRTPSRVVRRADFGGRQLWWEIAGPEEALPGPLIRHDLAATSLAFFAMHQGASLRIDGPVSRSLLQNLEDFVACWSMWRPDIYQRIEITAAEELDDYLEDDHTRTRAVAAFSGGVDGSFTLLRHVRKDVGRRTRDLIAGVLIHGMDIALENTSAFEVAKTTAQASLSSLSVPLAVVRTNWKEFAVDWEMEFGTAISSALRNWQGSAATGLLGSDEDYASLVLPWGGNPLSYSMLSTPNFTVVYDGGEYTRTDKVEYLSQWDEGLRSLRVCWAGPKTGHNCGACEKCLRTKLNFMAVGAELPPSLSGAPSIRQIVGIRARNSVQVSYLNEIILVASQRGINAQWVLALRGAMIKNRLMNRLRHLVILRALWRPLKSAMKALAGR